MRCWYNEIVPGGYQDLLGGETNVPERATGVYQPKKEVLPGIYR